MLHSTRWRLVISYALLTIVTVSAIGFIAQWAISSYVRQQSTRYLVSNAEDIARQALPFVEPEISPYNLSQLAQAAALFGNVRVRILDLERRLIVDTGIPDSPGELMWFVFHQEKANLGVSPPNVEWIIGLPGSQGTQTVWESVPFFHELPVDLPLTIVKRVEGPWGNRLSFESTTWRGAIPEIELLREIESLPRSKDVITVAIGEADNPSGYVELSEAANFSAESIATARRAFVLAGSIAVILAIGLGLIMGSRLTRPITKLTETTRQMQTGDLKARATITGKDEISELASQFNQMAAQLQASFDQLSSERDALRRFITDASHELRTPITALNNFNELLQGPAAEDDTVRTEFLAESQVQIERLSWITQNLLDISRLDADLVELKTEICNPRALIQTVIATYQTMAEKKGVEICPFLPETNLEFHCDRAWLEIAVSNLVDNAIKFTPAGGTIEIGVEQLEEQVRFWVKDTGAGIPADDLPYIYDRFYRGRNSTHSGSGLGLSIVKSVAQAHQGTVQVQSKPGMGSTFTMEFPTNLNTSRVY